MATSNGLSLLATSQFPLIHALVFEEMSSNAKETVADSLVGMISMLSEDSEDQLQVARAAYSLDTPAAVTMCMKQWLHNEEIQELALYCVYYLAVNNADSRDAIVSCGRVEAIVGSLKL